MNKNIRSFLAMCLLLAVAMTLPVSVMASYETPATSRKYITPVSTDKAVVATPRAVTAPTSYAPSSWYGVEHRWTCASYVYSSYIFQSSMRKYLDIKSPQKFSVEFYYPNGTLINSYTAEYDSSSGLYESNYYLYDSSVGHFNFYLIIRNQSGTPITNSADTTYMLWGSY